MFKFSIEILVLIKFFWFCRFYGVRILEAEMNVVESAKIIQFLMFVKMPGTEVAYVSDVV